MQFKEVLETLAPVDEVAAIELMDRSGTVVGRIENKPGSQGSLKVYHHLAAGRGVIGVAEANEGLALFAEHTADAQARPGAHPNIDRLLAIAASGEEYAVRIVSA